MKKLFCLILATGLLGGTLFPHHAMEYIETESYYTARMGEYVFHLHYDYFVEDQNNPFLDHYEWTPGLSYGLSNRLMLDVHTHFAKFGSDHVLPEKQYRFFPGGPSPFVEALAFSLQYRVTTSSPVQIAVSAFYETPFERSEDLLGGERAYGGILILSHSFSNHANITANLIWEKDGDAEGTAWALAAKIPLTGDAHGISAGVELLGDFDGEFSVLGGFYMPLGSPNIIFKTGLQVGKKAESLRMNVSLMYRF